MNLKPVSGDSYYQDFDVTTSARLGKKNSLTYSTGAARNRCASSRTSSR
jgi:hypothetical protein